MMPTYDLSTAADLQVTATVLADVCDEATRSGVSIMVVGAAARDILISHVVGSRLQLATTDVDIAVAVSSWSDVERLTQRMDQASGSLHKFIIRGTEVDIIPFGDIESADRTVTWANDHRMDVLGFREAYAEAIGVKLPGGLVVAVASLPAQSLLKLFAWRDRRYDSKRDAIDLRAILFAYHEGAYLDELYDDYEQLLVKHDFDPMLAGAERMGSEACEMLARRDRQAVTALLDSEELSDWLIGDMGGMPSLNRSVLRAYRQGFPTLTPH